MLEYLRKVNVSCVTAYKRGKSNNPEIEVIDQYNRVSDKVFSTYDILKNTYNRYFYGNGCDISHIRL